MLKQAASIVPASFRLPMYRTGMSCFGGSGRVGDKGYASLRPYCTAVLYRVPLLLSVIVIISVNC